MRMTENEASYEAYLLQFESLKIPCKIVYTFVILEN
jgi:hypothetical protein